MPRQYVKRTSCKRGHRYLPGSFRKEKILRSGNTYEVRQCLQCKSAAQRTRYKKDESYRELLKARAKAFHKRKRAACQNPTPTS